MKITTRTYVLHNVTHREQMVPPMFVVVDTYHPSGSVTPWDYYGGKHTGEIKRVLMDANIESVSLVEMQVNNTPRGSGPNGRVRFGDSMMPGVYRVAVSKYDVPAAERAIAAHQKAVEQWLHEGGKQPAPLAG